MHPAVRILFLVAIIASMVTANPHAVLAGFLLSMTLHWVSGLKLDGLVHTVLRLRWFFLSIMILYLWFMPGVPLLPAFGSYSPSRQGLIEGLVRCAVLIVILNLVHWLVGTTSRAQLIQGVYWLMRPVRCMRLKPEALAVRLALVLEIVPILQRKIEIRPSPADVQETRTRRIVSHAAEVLEAVLREADRSPRVEIELGTGTSPSSSEWLALIALLIVLTAVGMLFV